MDKFFQELDNDLVLQLSDKIAEDVNASFSEFVRKAFNTTEPLSKFAGCKRETCSTLGLFSAKKRYALMVYNKDGINKAKGGLTGELKIMGMETQRSDTPKEIQEFLKNVIQKVLEGRSESDIIKHIREFRKSLRTVDAWHLGSPKSVNNLTSYNNKIKNNVKGMVPEHVMASLNWNKMKIIHGDNVSMNIVDGQRIVVCKLKENPTQMKSVAYPVDEMNLPEWFKKLPFDHDRMEQILVDKKLGNMLGCMDWNLDLSKSSEVVSRLFKLED